MPGRLFTFDQQRTTQPQGALRLSTAGRPPIAVAVPREGGMLIEARGLAERMGVASGTGVRVAAGPLGLAVGSSATSINALRLHSVANQTNTVWERPSAQITMLALVLRRGNSVGNSSIFGNQSPSVSPYTAYAIVDGSGIGTHRSEISTGTGTTTLDTGTMPTGTPCVLVSTYDGATLRNYRNGLEVGSVAKTGTLVYPSGANRGPAVGNLYDYPGQARSFVGDIYLVALWDVALSAAEVAAVSRSQHAPWQLFAPETRRVWVPSAGGGNTVSVPAGTLTLTGFAPTVTAPNPQAVAVPAASLLLTAFAPSVLTPNLVSVPAAALTLTPYAPTVAATANKFINPPAAALTLTGYPPTVAAGGGTSISVPAAGLTLTGYVPTVTAGASATVAVPAAALTLTGFAPSVVLGARVAVPAGALTLTSFAPSVVTTTGSYVFPPAAALALTGYAPDVSNGVSAIPTMPPYITVYMWLRTA